jgi:hypothetical protein
MDNEEDLHKQDQIDDITVTVKEQNQNIVSLVTVIGNLANKVKEIPGRKYLWRAFATVVVVLVLVVSLGGFFLHESSRDNRRALDLIESCIVEDHKGDCFERSQSQTANAVQVLICNQEKILYFTHPGYVPIDECAEYVNSEIERLEANN